MRNISILVFALFVFCFGIVVPGCTQSAGGVAPEVSAGTWINTESFKIADHKDKIVVVEFWATWCPPCRASIPHLKTLHETYADKGVILCSLTNEPAETVKEFNKKAGMTWIVGTDSSSGNDYGVSGIPSAFIVVDGNIVWNGHPMNGLDAELEKLVSARTGNTDAAPVAAPAPTATDEAPATADEAPLTADDSDETPVDGE